MDAQINTPLELATVSILNSDSGWLAIRYPTNMVNSFFPYCPIKSTFDQTNNSNLQKPTMLCNAFTSYRIIKVQGELKASTMEILKQYRNVFNTANSYNTTTRITDCLQQFYMLTFSYYPRKFGKTEIKSRGR